MDKARILEGKQNRAEKHKRKHDHGSSHSGKHQKPHNACIDGDSSGYNQHGGSGHDHHNHKNHHNNNGNGNGNNNTKKKDLSQLQCYHCKNLGHYASKFPEKKKNGNSNGSKPNPFQEGHVNHINMHGTVEEIDNVVGKF
jgi:hypothetical protein